jgi:hypothetical protein
MRSLQEPLRERTVVLLVAAVATIWMLVLTFPLVLHLTTGFYGRPGDASGAIAVYWWWSYALHHGLSLFQNTMVGAPLGAGWEAIPFTVLDVAIMAPLSFLVGPTLAYNLQNLSSFPLTAVVTYLLAREAGASRLGSAFAGLALAFIPYHLEKAMGHVTQTHLELFAGTLLFLLIWRRTRQWRYVIFAALVFGATIWWDFYYTVIVGCLVAAFFALDLLVPDAAGNFGAAHVGRWLKAVGLMAVVAAAFLPLAVLAIHRPGTSGAAASSLLGGAGDVRRPLSELQIYTARWREYVFPWHANPLVPEQIRSAEFINLHGSNFTEQSLFLGYTAMVLAAVGAVIRRRTFVVLLSLVVAAVGAVMATPPFMRPLGLVDLHGPSYYLNSILPFVRVYARFAVLLMLAVCLLAGLGLTVIQRHLPAKAGFVLAVPFLLLALEFNNVPPTHVTVLFPAPAAYAWLASQPQGILIEYPLASGDPSRQEELTHQYMAYQQVHLHPIFNGAVSTSPAGLLTAKLEPFYSDSTVDALRTLGIRYVFVHASTYRRDGYQVPIYPPSGLRHLATMQDIDVYLVTGATG